MQEPSHEWRQCPTRPDGAEVLIEHRIHGSTCQERQRKLYHKCFSCVHRDAAHVPGTGALPPLERLPVHTLPAVPPQPKLPPGRRETGGPVKRDARQAG